MKSDITLKDLSPEQVVNVMSLFTEGKVVSPVTEQAVTDKENQPHQFVGSPLPAIVNNGWVAPQSPEPVSTTPAPVATTQPATPGQLDANNLPWDERIHSGNRSLTAKGVWQKKRNVDDALVTSVEAELRGMSQPITGAPSFVTTISAPVAQLPMAAIAQVMAPPAAAPVQVQAPAPVATNDFAGFMNTMNGLFAAQQATPEYMKSIQDRIGVAYNVQLSAITDIIGQQHYIDYAFQLLRHDGKIA